MTPAVSVVIPTHNYAHFLGESLDSVLGQTWSDLEVIVVDDGSTDETAAVVAARGDPRVHYIRQECRGPAAASNRGLSAATGQYLARLDADDAWLPHKLARQLEALTHADVGLVYTNTAIVDVNGAQRGVQFPGRRSVPHTGWVLPQLLAWNFVTTSTVLLRRAVLDDVGLHDESLEVCEDWDLWLRIAARYQFGYVDDSLVRYRVHSANAHKKAAAMVRDELRVLEQFGRTTGQWDHLGPGVRRHAYAMYHLRAAVALYGARQYWRSIRHIGISVAYDWRTIEGPELRLAARCVLGGLGVAWAARMRRGSMRPMR